MAALSLAGAHDPQAPCPYDLQARCVQADLPARACTPPLCDGYQAAAVPGLGGIAAHPLAVVRRERRPHPSHLASGHQLDRSDEERLCALRSFDGATRRARLPFRKEAGRASRAGRRALGRRDPAGTPSSAPHREHDLRLRSATRHMDTIQWWLQSWYGAVFHNWALQVSAGPTARQAVAHRRWVHREKRQGRARPIRPGSMGQGLTNRLDGLRPNRRCLGAQQPGGHAHRNVDGGTRPQ